MFVFIDENKVELINECCKGKTLFLFFEASYGPVTSLIEARSINLHIFNYFLKITLSVSFMGNNKQFKINSTKPYLSYQNIDKINSIFV